MLIKFFGGKGGGGAIANYLVDPERAGREGNPPEVLRGDIQQTRELIDSQDRKWTFTTGVISFAPTDAPSKSDQEKVMDDFERLAFAGLERDQYDITWVRHSHTSGGRVELHFLVPRMELSTGKALNIAPPGWERSYAPLRDAWNHEKGWARPDDPGRAREQQWTFESQTRAESRTAITSYLEDRIVNGQIESRADIVATLKDAGFDVPREGKDYITALDQASGQRFRLKGRIYEQGWTRDTEYSRETESQVGSGIQGGGRADPDCAADARRELAGIIDRRAEANRRQYQRPDDGDRGTDTRQQGQDAGRADGDRDQAKADDAQRDDHERGNRRDRGDDPLGRDELAGDQRDRDGRDMAGAKDRDQGAGDADQRPGRDRTDGDRRADSADAARDNNADISMRGNTDTLRQDRGVGGDGPVNQLRESALARVQELGRHIRNIGLRLSEYGSAALEIYRALFRRDSEAGQQTERAGRAARDSDRSLEQADRINTSTDRQREQVDQRASEIERVNEREDRIREITQKHRGDRER